MSARVQRRGVSEITRYYDIDARRIATGLIDKRVHLSLLSSRACTELLHVHFQPTKQTAM